MSTGSMGFRRAAAVVAVGALVASAPPSFAQDGPQHYVSDRVDMMALLGSTLYWATGCGGEFSPPTPRVRAVNGDSAAASPQTLYASSACPPERPVPEAIGAFGNWVFWITGHGRVVRLPRNATSASRPVEIARTEASSFGTEAGLEIAADASFVYWSEPAGVFRAPLDGGERQLIHRTRGRVWRLEAGGDGTVYLLELRRTGRLLLELEPTSALPYEVNDVVGVASATDFALDASAIYWSSVTSGRYTIRSRTRTGVPPTRFGPVVTWFSSPSSARPVRTVDAIAVDAASVYWHVVADVRGGPVVRLNRTSRRVEPISEHELMAHPMMTNGRWLFWSDFNSGIFRLRTGARATTPLSPATTLTYTDVSPDKPYGDGNTTADYDPWGADPAGRVVGLETDPTAAGVVYAAAERSGVWKTSDGGRTWDQFSRGLGSGQSVGRRPLAVDDRNPSRLLYATTDFDWRQDLSTGGLWWSNDGALNWVAARIPGCAPPIGAGTVAFASGRAFAVTRCGIATSTDLATWSLLRAPAPGVVPTFVTARGSTVFACAGARVWRSTRLGRAGSWTPMSGADLSGGCEAMALVPNAGDIQNVVGVLHANGSAVDVSLVAFDGSPRTVLSNAAADDAGGSSFRSLEIAGRRAGPSGGSGPGVTFDVFVTRGGWMLQYRPGGGWTRIQRTHLDSWAMAFPRHYNPAAGICAAYLATDGGVSKNVAPLRPGTECVTADGPWVRAMSGLHAYGGYNMAAIDALACGSPLRACPALYVPSGDNGLWFSLRGGARGTWSNFTDCCGDNGFAITDPGLPSAVISGRNGVRRLYAGTGPPVRGAAISDLWQNGMEEGPAVPPNPSAFAQIMTPAGTRAGDRPDLVAVRSAGGTADDYIIRNRDGSWTEMAPAAHFAPDTVALLAVSGGHARPTVWVGLTDGSLRRGRVDGSGVISSWTNVTAGVTPGSERITRAANIFVNPYDPGEAYVTDADAIRFTPDGGRTWRTSDALTRAAQGVDPATGRSTFMFACGDSMCPLTGMVFSRERPEVRVALLTPRNIAFSRDAGAHWMVLGGHIRGFGGLLGTPYSGWYDAISDPATGRPALYLTLRGRGVIRVEGAFDTLQTFDFELCPRGAPCTAGMARATSARRPFRHVKVVNESTGVGTRMRLGTDGVWRATQVFDGAGRARVRYHFVIDRHRTRSFSRPIPAKNRRSGVVLGARRPPAPVSAVAIKVVKPSTGAVGYGPCAPPTATSLTVSAQLAGDRTTGATLQYRFLRYNRAKFYFGVFAGVYRRVPMAPTDAGDVQATIDVTAQAPADMQGRDGVLQYQVLHRGKRGTAASNVGEVTVTPCDQKPPALGGKLPLTTTPPLDGRGAPGPTDERP